MEISTVNLSEIDLSDRIDAEYFQTRYLHIERALEKKEGKPLNQFAQIVGSAFYPAATHLYKIGEIPFIRCVDSISFPLITQRQRESFERIPLSFANEHNNIKKLNKGEIVITKVGTPCYASIIHDIDRVALSRTVLGLKSIRKVNPYYLLAFLRSKYGFSQLFRERELTIQFQLTLERVGNILVYLPKKDKFEEMITKLILGSEKYKDLSKTQYKESEERLLQEVGLKNWKDNHKLSFIRPFSRAKDAERLDAEYFQPKYDQIKEAILNYKNGYKKLKKLVKIKKGIEVGRKAYQDEGIPFIRISNLSKMEITEEKYIDVDLYEEHIEYQPKRDEIFLSKDGTPGIAYHIKNEPRKMIPASGILRLKIKNDEQIKPEYLTLVLNSRIVQEQINRDVSGAIILHWRKSDIKNVLIPLLNEKTQNSINKSVMNSFDNLTLAKNMFQDAVKAVEIAIEKDEETAILYIEKKYRI